MRSSNLNGGDEHDDQHIPMNEHDSLSYQLQPAAIHDMYSNFFSSFCDPIGNMNITAYPYPLHVGGPMDMNMSLQQTLMQLDVADTHIGGDLAESYVTPELQSPSPVQPISMQNRPNISFSQSNGHTHTMLPPMIQPNPNDPSMQFDSETRTFNQRITNTGNSQSDPYASNFLKARLGPEKFNIFSARLSERRVSSKVRDKSTSPSPNLDSKPAGATAVDFLVKVEVVKEILRTYVPHPYNPLKSLTHPFEGSPKGSVTLTRSTVLILSGWSNTQFSYWARRAEAISVLGQYDDRLHSVGTALKRRLGGEVANDAAADLPEKFLDPQSITGKGLDVIIDDVKKRTGVSQFLRGKHSSLDPFGSVCVDGEFGVGVDAGMSGKGVEPSARTVVFSATFQAVAYEHSPPPPAHPPSGVVQQRRGRGKRGRGKGAGKVVEGHGPKVEDQVAPIQSDKPIFPQPTTSASTSTSSSASTLTPCSSPHASDSDYRPVGSTATFECTGTRDSGVQIPMSDSRSQLELEEALRKRKLVTGKVVSGKRLRISGR